MTKIHTELLTIIQPSHLHQPSDFKSLIFLNYPFQYPVVLYNSVHSLSNTFIRLANNHYFIPPRALDIRKSLHLESYKLLILHNYREHAQRFHSKKKNTKVSLWLMNAGISFANFYGSSKLHTAQSKVTTILLLFSTHIIFKFLEIQWGSWLLCPNTCI